MSDECAKHEISNNELTQDNARLNRTVQDLESLLKEE